MYLDKKLSELSAREYVSIHLNHGRIPGGEAVTRLQDCQILTMTGTLLGEAKHASLFTDSRNILPVLGWFAVLDQLGSCYINKAKPRYPDRQASGVKKSLYYLCSFAPNDEQTKTLYALRNALVHDSSFFSRGNNNRSNYFFRYDYSLESCIQSSINEWNGHLTDIREEVITLVNPKGIKALAESAYTKAFQLLQEDNLDIELQEDNLDIEFDKISLEIAYRYLLTTHDESQA
jgi:hypothetical protein